MRWEPDCDFCRGGVTSLGPVHTIKCWNRQREEKRMQNTDEFEMYRRVRNEMGRQKKLMHEGRFPWTCHNPEISDSAKLTVLAEEFGEVAREVCEIQQILDTKWPGEIDEIVISSKQRGISRRRENLKKELIQLAAISLAWCEALDQSTD
jgi:hypothetical protein